jgi:hypothetical protein
MAAAPAITATPASITGHAADVGIDFSATLTTPTHAVVDIDFGLKRVHADVDYAAEQLIIHSIAPTSGTPAGLSLVEIARFQRLLHEIPAALTVSGHHADALGSLISLLAGAPVNVPIDIDTKVDPRIRVYTSICGEIGSDETAFYTLDHMLQSSSATVGPMCYVAPATGRCGMGGGPDPVIGLVQRFTQECFNHDVCCNVTGDRVLTIAGVSVNVCGFKGNDCLPQFRKAAIGFFFAPSCGTTAGTWTDNYDEQYTLTGGLDSGDAKDLKGTVDTGNADCPNWIVHGTRTGTAITLTAHNPSGASEECAGNYTFTGTYSDCGAAGGSWTNDAGLAGDWTWERTNVAGQVVLKFNPAALRPTDRPKKSAAN